MSNRAVRKVKLEEEKSNKSLQEESDDDVAGTVSNPFDLLGTGDETRPDEEDESEDKTTQSRQTTKGSGKKTSKKKKKKNPPTVKKEIEDDFALLEIDKNNKPQQQNSAPKFSINSLIQPDIDHLDYEAEMKSIFGSDVHRDSRKRQGGRSVRYHLRRYSIISPEPSWPQLPLQEKYTIGGVTIQHVSSSRGIDYFKVVWLPEYQKLQNVFFACVQTGDVQTLVALSEQYPYHVDTLLQLNEACKVTHQLDLSVQFIKRIIYRFEACWRHPSNKPTKKTEDASMIFSPLSPGKFCRLEYRHKENRSYFIAMHKYIQILDRQGCCRTALEISKILLSFDLTDPLGVLLMIDNLAVRSQQYEFLLSIYLEQVQKQTEQQNDEISQISERILLLPNWAFSVALARFCMDESVKESTKESKDSHSKISQNFKSAEVLLQEALQKFPVVGSALMRKLGVSDAIQEEDILSTLFVERNHSLWKKPNVTQWLKRVSSTVVIDNKNPSQSPLNDSMFYRHSILLDNSEALKKIPNEIVQKGLQIYDEELPSDTPKQEQQQQPESITSVATTAVQVLSLFLNSLLPNYVSPTQQTQHTATNAVNMLGPQGYVAQLLQEQGLGVSNPEVLMMERQQQQQEEEDDWE